MNGRVSDPSQEMKNIPCLAGKEPLLPQNPQRIVEIGARIEIKGISSGERLRHMLGILAQFADRRRRILMESPLRQRA